MSLKIALLNQADWFDEAIVPCAQQRTQGVILIKLRSTDVRMLHRILPVAPFFTFCTNHPICTLLCTLEFPLILSVLLLFSCTLFIHDLGPLGLSSLSSTSAVLHDPFLLPSNFPNFLRFFLIFSDFQNYFAVLNSLLKRPEILLWKSAKSWFDTLRFQPRLFRKLLFLRIIILKKLVLKKWAVEFITFFLRNFGI